MQMATLCCDIPTGGFLPNHVTVFEATMAEGVEPYNDAQYSKQAEYLTIGTDVIVYMELPALEGGEKSCRKLFDGTIKDVTYRTRV